jgi:hypothetical protein
MSKSTEHFGILVVRGLRNHPLELLDRYFRTESPDDSAADFVAMLAKLNDADKAALRSTFANIIDESIKSFLYVLDDVANTEDGIRVSYNKKPLSEGDYTFSTDLPKWRQQFDNYDDAGNRK